MKGIVLAGGKATRLRPITYITSKQLLLVYDKPMIYYPIRTLVKAGIKDILVIVAPDFSGSFVNLLSMEQLKEKENWLCGEFCGVDFTFKIQLAPRGLADAFIIGEDFIGKDDVTMILGDNIFLGHDFSEEIRNFKSGAMVFAKQVHDPERFGVVEFDKKMKVVSIEEKPKKPKSNYAVVGLYAYDNRVVKYAKNLKPSKRGEIEVTDLNKVYLERNQLKVNVFDGTWADAGTFDALQDIQAEIRARKAQGEIF
ncbi:MAG: sugar phosphate nucleotidyltransferase [Candidatus Subteraquimicrobiales bacterium]|nr:sugar phosphate nucleotidyltransferase [Candidatus Subteraquimicrobiales bacterium]